eukprot:m.141534 g.141534  ORF g.141534 m.141534 type:complete len:260 (-) comp40844_c0_seq1:25-804(-)
MFIQPFVVLLMVFVIATQGREIDVNWGIDTWPQASISISMGDTVKWTWSDGSPHNIVSGSGRIDDGLFTSGALVAQLGYTFNFTFTTPGDFSYFCAQHSFMLAKITVNPTTSGSTSSPPSPTPQATMPTTATTTLPPFNVDCSTKTSSFECEAVRTCIFNFDKNKCRNKTCLESTQKPTCEALSGCKFNSTISICYEEGTDIPCSRYTQEKFCPPSRCLFESPMCFEEGSPPCTSFSTKEICLMYNETCAFGNASFFNL